MLPGRRRLIVGRKCFEQLDVSRQCGTCEQAFKQIVTEHRIFRHLARQRRFECVDLVNAFARVGPFPKEILIHIRHGRCVGVDPAGPGKGLLKVGTLAAAWERRCNPRLYDPISFKHTPDVRVESRPVQRVCHRTDEPVGGSTRQPGICIQRDDEPDRRDRFRRLPTDGHEGGARRAAEPLIQLMQFASFPFPSHPHLLGLVPDSSPVQQDKTRTAAGRWAIPLVQMRDPFYRGGQQFGIPWHTFTRSIFPV